MFALWLGCVTYVYPAAPKGGDEDCLNQADDDNDGLIDCADADCLPVCDADADGFFAQAAGGDDCDDARSEAFPFAPEVCNTLDDDCDGLIDLDDVDLDLSTRLLARPDGDGDGFGDRDTWALVCELPAGHVLDASDCNDADASAFPGGGELCNGTDDDCDGLVDQADPDLVAAALDTYYADADGDGLGDPTTSEASCFARDGWTIDASDCDDLNADLPSLFAQDADGDGVPSATVQPTPTCEGPDLSWIPAGDLVDCNDADPLNFPGNAESCTDLIDNDCDGRAEICGPVGDLTWSTHGVWGQANGAAFEFGLSVGGATADGAGQRDVGVGFSGGVALFEGGDLHGLLNLTDAYAQIQGPGGGGVGESWISFGDADGDGNSRLVLAAPGILPDGEVYMLDGPNAGIVDAATAADAVWQGGPGEPVQSVMAMGQVIGGASEDFGIVSGAGAGTVWILSAGSLPGAAPDVADATLTGDSDGDEFGATGAAIADLDGDGLVELALSSPGYDGVASNSGRVDVFTSPIPAFGVADDSSATVRGVSADLALAAKLSGDVDGDGRDDLCMGTPTSGGTRGAVWCIVEISGLDYSVEDAALTVTTTDELAMGASLGWGLLDAGLEEDLVIGSDATLTNSEAGRSWWFYGPLTGVLDVSGADATFFGAEGDLAGIVAVIPDVQGDGVDDVIVGAPGAGGGGAFGVVFGAEP